MSPGDERSARLEGVVIDRGIKPARSAKSAIRDEKRLYESACEGKCGKFIGKSNRWNRGNGLGR